MLDRLDIYILADEVCEYCGMPYIKRSDEDEDDNKQCRDCNIADWKYGGPWHERYDNDQK